MSLNQRVFFIQPLIRKYRVPFFNGLASSGKLKVVVYSQKVLNEDIKIDFEIRSMKEYSFFKRNFFWQIIPCYMEIKKGDIIVFQGNMRILSNIMYMLISKMRGIKVVWWGHGWTAAGNKIAFYFRRAIMKRLPELILLYTEKEKNEFVANGFCSQKVFGINNTIDTSEIDTLLGYWNNEWLTEFKKENQLLNRKVILFCSRLTEKTELEKLFYSLTELVKEDKTMKAVIVGDGPMLGNYKKMVHELSLHENVIFKGALFKESDLAPWFLSSDLFVYPGSIGLSLLHAFAYGLPVLTHDKETYQMPEYSYLVEKETGFTFKKNNINDLTVKIKEVLSSNNEEIRKNCYNVVRGKYSMEAMVENTIKAIVNL